MRQWILMAVLVFLAAEARADVYSVGQPPVCSNGSCQRVLQVVHNSTGIPVLATQYVDGSGRECQPRGGLFQGRIINAIQNRPKLFGRRGCCGQ